MTAAERIRRVFTRGASVFLFARAAPFYARYTVRFHLPAELLIGGFVGVFQLANVLTKKTLGAPDWVVAWQTSVPMMTFALAMVWRDLLAGRDRRRALVLTGIFGKGLLVLVAFVTSPGPLLAIVILYSVVDSAFIPIRNSIFQANYDRTVRGRFFGGVASLTHLALVSTNLLAAWCLSVWEESYRFLFPAAAVLGIASHLVYARVRVRRERSPDADRPREEATPPLASIGRAIGRAFSGTARILRADRDFRAYETAFFIYGLAFLMNLPLVVLLVVDELDLTYEKIALGTFVASQLMSTMLSTVAGRLLDRSHPATLMAGACALLAAHAAILAGTTAFWMLAASYLVFGVAMTLVNLGWNLGPMHFAPTEKRAADYMAVHVTLTGLRAVIGPALALGAKHFLGIRAGFAVSAGLYILASLLMLALFRRLRGNENSSR